MTRRTYLWIECVSLFGLVPVLLLILQLQLGPSSRNPFFFVLFALLALTLVLTYRNPSLRFRPPSPSSLSPVRFALRIGLAGTVLLFLTARIDPDLLFRFPRERPSLWLAVMMLYPLLSVAPQEFLYRTFFMQRYEPLFGSGAAMIAVNAFFFGWGHIFFVNWIAPVLSTLGGVLLATTWRKTQRFRWVCLEHALYGQLVFTIGIGWFFHSGSIHSLEQLSGL